MIFPGQRHRREECDHHGHRHPLEEDLQVTHLDEFPRVVVIRRAIIGGTYNLMLGKGSGHPSSSGGSSKVDFTYSLLNLS